MLSRLARRQRSVYKRYFMTYCSIALLPVLAIVSCLYILTENSHMATASDLYRQAIVQAASHIDGFVLDLQSSVSLLDTDTRISGMLDEPSTSAMAESVLAEYLAKVEENSRIPLTVLYYSVGDTNVFTAEGRMPYKDFENAFSTSANLTMSSFFTQLNTVTAMKAWLLDTGSKQAQDGSEPSYIAFAFPTFQYNAFKRGTVAFLVSMQDVLRVVADYVGQQPEYLYLYTANYQLIGQYESAPLTEENRTTMMRLSNNVIAELELDGEQRHVIRYKTDRYGFQIVSAVRLDRMYGNMGEMHLSLLLISLAVMLVVGAVAILLARYSYRPIRALLENLGTDDDTDADLPEFERIDQRLSSMNQEMATLKLRLSSQLPMVRDRILKGLLRGTLSQSGMQQLQNVCPDILLSEQSLYVVLITPQEADCAACQAYLERIDLCGADGHGVYLEEERIFALLMLQPLKEQNQKAQCIALEAVLRQGGLLLCRIGVGTVVVGAEDVPRSYLEAYIALHKAQQEQLEHPAFYEELGTQEYAADHVDQEANAIGIYLQSVRSVDEKTALAMLYALRTILENACSSALNISYTRFDLFSRTLSACEKDVIAAHLQSKKDISTFSDAEKFWELMAQLTIDNCQAVTARRELEQNKTSQMIVDTVREHCCDRDFSLQSLSSMVGYSSTYINRCLRECTGYSFIQLISILRIARAKEELRGTDHLIKAIVEHVGYLDVASFTRKFKELEGVTPTEYRRINASPLS